MRNQKQEIKNNKIIKYNNNIIKININSNTLYECAFQFVKLQCELSKYLLKIIRKIK